MTKSRFLHVEDALNIGKSKIRLFAGNYRRNKGMSSYCQHFLDLADARVIFSALARGEQGFSHKEYKGTPLRTCHLDRLGAGSEQGRRNDNLAVSRVLSIVVKGDNVYIEFKNGPGKQTSTGAIVPDGPPQVVVNVGFKLYEARCMAAAVLAYIHAWDLLRMMAHEAIVSRPAPYLLVPTGRGMGDGQEGEAANKIAPASSHVPAAASEDGRPLTRETSQPTTTTKPSPPPAEGNGRSQNGHTKQNGNDSSPQALLYGDGTPVSADNQTERSTYTRYRQAKGTIPLSKSALLQYYQQQTAA